MPNNCAAAFLSFPVISNALIIVFRSPRSSFKAYPFVRLLGRSSISSTVIQSSFANRTARLTTARNSRMFPGHEYVLSLFLCFPIKPLDTLTQLPVSYL